MIENVTHGSRRTVDLSLPIGMKEDTRARKIKMRIKIRMDIIEKTSDRLAVRAVKEAKVKVARGLSG